MPGGGRVGRRAPPATGALHRHRHRCRHRYDLVPRVVRPEPTSEQAERRVAPRQPTAVVRVLDVEVDATSLHRLLRAEPLVPVLSDSGDVVFARAADAIRLPSSFTEHLSAAEIHTWLGAAPLAPPSRIGPVASSALFDGLPALDLARM